MLLRGAEAFAVAHFFVVGRMMYRSFDQRQLSFVRLRRRHATAVYSGSTTPKRVLVRSTAAERRRSRTFGDGIMSPLRLGYWLWRRYFSIDGLFGLNGKHFVTMFTVREVVEMLSQLYQAYLLSVSVTTPWINHFAIAVVVINSISGLTIRLVCSAMEMRASTRHLLVLIIDVALDLCGSVLIPVCILLQVVREFDWTTMTIPMAFLNNDAWLVRRIAEVHQLIVTSTLDLISMLALNFGVLGAMQTIAHDLRRDQSRGSHTTRIGILVPPSTSSSSRVSSAVLLTENARRLDRRKRCGHWLMDVVFLLCGVAAIGMRAYYNRDIADAPFCLSHVNAWFVRKFPCAVVRINCHRFSVHGSAASILRSLDETVLVSVSFVHCANAVNVPLELRAFSAIRQLKFINVSAITWPPGFVLDDAHFPRLSYLMFGHTNMTDVPDELRHARLPLAMREMEWSYSNLSALPDDIGRFWATREWLLIVLDHTQLTTLPRAFGAVRCRHLSLVGTHIEMLLDDVIDFQALRTLVVSGSPLRALPLFLGAPATSSSKLEHVLAEYTQIESLPTDGLGSWSLKTDAVLSLYGSPMCADEEMRRAQDRWCATDRSSAQGMTRWDLLWPFVPVET